jgi:Inorganic pyrophosphatase
MENPYKDIIGKTVDIIMDRPLGTQHPKHEDILYTVNYGYIPNVMGGDGEEQDCYLLGVSEPVKTYTAKIIAVIHRLNDCEDKYVAVPEGQEFSKEEISKLTYFQEKYFDSEIHM